MHKKSGFGVVLGAFAAATVATSIGIQFGFPVVVALLAGSALAVAMTWLLGSPPRFAATGAIYFLSSALLFHLSRANLPEAYSQDAMVGLVLFGLVSLSIVLVQEIIGVGIRKAVERVANEEYAGIIWRVISAFAGLLLMVWMVLTAQEKIARYGGSAGVGSATFVLNLIGIEIPIPVWFLSGVDATIVLYVGATLVGFHVLDTLHAGWRAAKVGAKGAATAASKGASTVKSAGTTASNKASQLRDESS